MEMNTRTDCNIAAKGTRKRVKIELTVEPNKFYSKLCQPFLQALIGDEYSKAILGLVFEKKILISY